MKKMKLPIVLLVAALSAIPRGASAQSTYTTTNGTVNLFAGLTNLSSATAINTTNQSVGIGYITDGSWSTGILNLGAVGSPATPNNGTLAGSFGGTYFGNSNGIILIGLGAGAPAWGSWTIRLLLSDDTYSSAISFSDADLVTNVGVLSATNTSIFQNVSGSQFVANAFDTFYQELNIAAFDTGDIGFKGIELSNMGANYPEISYIGVTNVIPEPSTYALLALSAAGLGGYVLRRRRK